jgi:hypothetical protein
MANPFWQLCKAHFPTTTSRELAALMLEKEIGTGQYRHVWSSELNPGRVLKVEMNDCAFKNVMEWEVWQAVKDTKFSRWFAPCYAISPVGVWMVQHRTTPLDHIDQLPKRIPAFFTDLKPNNWGLIDGRVVCHDYSNHLMLEEGMTKKLKQARWRT